MLRISSQNNKLLKTQEKKYNISFCTRDNFSYMKLPRCNQSIRFFTSSSNDFKDKESTLVSSNNVKNNQAYASNLNIKQKLKELLKEEIKITKSGNNRYRLEFLELCSPEFAHDSCDKIRQIGINAKVLCNQDGVYMIGYIELMGSLKYIQKRLSVLKTIDAEGVDISVFTK